RLSTGLGEGEPFFHFLSSSAKHSCHPEPTALDESELHPGAQCGRRGTSSLHGQGTPIEVPRRDYWCSTREARDLKSPWAGAQPTERLKKSPHQPESPNHIGWKSQTGET